MCDINICGTLIICYFFLSSPFHKRAQCVCVCVCATAALLVDTFSKWSKLCTLRLLIYAVCSCVCVISIVRTIFGMLAAICAYKKGETCYYLMKLTKCIHGQILILFFFSFHFISFFLNCCTNDLNSYKFDRSLIFKALIEHQIKRTNLKLVFNFSDDKRTKSNAYIEY